MLDSRILPVDEDISALDQIISLLIMRPASDWKEMTQAARLEDQKGIDRRVDIPVESWRKCGHCGYQMLNIQYREDE